MCLMYILYVLHDFASICMSMWVRVIQIQSHVTLTHKHGVSDALCHTRGYSGHYKGIEEDVGYCHTTSRPRYHDHNDDDNDQIHDYG